MIYLDAPSHFILNASLLDVQKPYVGVDLSKYRVIEMNESFT